MRGDGVSIAGQTTLLGSSRHLPYGAVMDMPPLVETKTAGNSAAPAAAAPAPSDLADPRLYTNRELSWLDFDERVLAEAADERNPLLERVRFLAIAANNLDEFFMIRVSALKQQLRAGVTTPTPDGLTAREQLAAIDERHRRILGELARCARDLLAECHAQGFGILTYGELDKTEQARSSADFRARIFPVLTPLAVDPAHPFPFISNLSLNL